MRGHRLSVLTVVAVLGLLTVVSTAHAGQSQITLNTPKEFTVVALTEAGTSSSVSGSGQLAVTPLAKRVTLHLVSNGKYFGPVVVGKKGKRVIVGVKAGGDLGRLKIRNGYATATPASDQIDPKLTAKATKAGKPIGAGRAGLVKTSANGKPGEGKDQDADGLPGAFDIDDNGDLVIDNVDKQPDSKPGSPQKGDQPAKPNEPGKPEQPGPPSSFRVFSNLKLDLAGTMNANVSPASPEQIDAALATNQTLAIEVVKGERTSLNCNGLTYCSLGGTGRSGSPLAPFPDAGALDENGFGIITPGQTGDFQLWTGASTSAISAGDTYIEYIKNGDQVAEVPGILNFYFVSTPALTKVASEGVADTEINYPVSNGEPGTASNPIGVAANGKAKFTFWRPEREPVQGTNEGPGLIDVGQLKYFIDVPNAPAPAGQSGGSGPGLCAAESYKPISPDFQVSGNAVVDQSQDQPAEPAKTLTLEVDLAKCLATKGINWASGQVLHVDIQALSNNGDNAAQKVYLKRL